MSCVNYFRHLSKLKKLHQYFNVTSDLSNSYVKWYGNRLHQYANVIFELTILLFPIVTDVHYIYDISSYENDKLNVKNIVINCSLTLEDRYPLTLEDLTRSKIVRNIHGKLYHPYYLNDEVFENGKIKLLFEPSGLVLIPSHNVWFTHYTLYQLYNKLYEFRENYINDENTLKWLKLFKQAFQSCNEEYKNSSEEEIIKCINYILSKFI